MRRDRTSWAALGLATSVAALSCGAAPFACLEAGDCVGPAGAAGTCESSGWCSFPDEACPSGHRYGDHAASSVANDCVPSETSTSDASSEGTTSMTSVTTVDPTLASLEGSSVEESTDTQSSTVETTVTSVTSSDTESDACGDGVVQAGEQCDLGRSNGNGSHCHEDCSLNACGDGIIAGAEQCDGGEGCSNDCNVLRLCGDGILNPNEACDGATEPSDCLAFGFSSGEVECSQVCEYDFGNCIGCGPEGCDFDPCDSEADCAQGRVCNGGYCTVHCSADDDCSGQYQSNCEGEVCVLLCGKVDCPDPFTCLLGVCV